MGDNSTGTGGDFNTGEGESMGGDSFLDYDDDDILTVQQWSDASKGSKSSISFSTTADFKMPSAEDMGKSIFSFPQQYNAPFSEHTVAARNNPENITRAMEDPNLGCDLVDPIPLKKPPNCPTPMALLTHHQGNKGSSVKQFPTNVSASATLHSSAVSEYLRIQQEHATFQYLVAQSLSASQHVGLQQMPFNSANTTTVPTMIQGPWGFAPNHPMLTPSTLHYEAMRGRAMAHPGQAPASMMHGLSGTASIPETPVGTEQDILMMETTSQKLEPGGKSIAQMNNPGTDAAVALAHLGISDGVENNSQNDSEKKPAAKKKSRPVVHPKPKDICFARINHPGTIAWREKVDNLSDHVDLEWSDLVHQAVRSQLEAEGRRFLVCMKTTSGQGQSKGVKNKEWRTATDDEIKQKTKQRFRDRRKLPKNEVRRPRGRPSKTSPALTSEGQGSPLKQKMNVEVREAFLDAIEKCQQAMVLATTSTDSSILEKGKQAEEKLELLLPMKGLPWSHVLESDLQHRQGARVGKEQSASSILQMESDMAKRCERIKKLKKAEIQIVNFIQCLMESGSNELNAALGNVHGEDSDDGRGDGGTDDEDDGDDEDDEDDWGGDDMNARQRLASLNMESYPRKRGRGAGVSAADPDYYHYDLLTVFQATPLAFTSKSGEAQSLPQLDVDFERKVLTEALRDTESFGARIDVEFEVATTDRLGAFFAKGESHVMHLSCHGHPDYLAIDNGWGGMQIIRVHELEPFIRFGAGNLELVFLSSCCTRPAGDAFVAAGVPHVVCCHHDQKPRDKVAMEFARKLYRALACGKTLKIAFNMARQSVQVPSQRSQLEAGKFVLLPEKPDDSDYHDVRIFSQRNKRLKGLNVPKVNVMRPFPCLPGNVKINPLDVYHVLEMLAHVDVVKVMGASGGRRIAAAVASYIRGRPHTMNLDDVFWFPPVVDFDEASKLFRHVGDVLVGDSHLSNESLMGEGSKYFSYFNEAMSYFVGKRCLFVINAKRFTSDVQSSRLESFVCDILDDLNAKVILVCNGDTHDRYSRLLRHREQISTYTPMRFGHHSLYDDKKGSRNRPPGSEGGVAGDEEGFSDLSEGSGGKTPFGTETKEKLAQSIVPGSAPGTAKKPMEGLTSRERTKPKRVQRGQGLATHQLGPLLDSTLRSRINDNGKKRKEGTRRKWKGDRDDGSCTDVSSDEDSSEEKIPLQPIKTLDAFDATTGGISTLIQPAVAGQTVAFSEVTPFLKNTSTRGFHLDTTGKARLYGRDSEIVVLKEAYDRVSQPSASSEVITVHGPSGTGKSTLVKHMEEMVGLDRSGIFASGKFDQINAASRPYSAIVDAISRLCHKIADGAGLDNVKLSIKQTLGSEVKVISELIPAVALLTGEATTGEVAVFSEFAFTRFKGLFRSFIRAVSSADQPIVLFFDDLQWADNASCALMESFASDSDSKNILFVWAYRDDELGEIPSFVTNVVNSSLRLSDVPVGAVDSKCLTEMIADITHLSPKEVKPLSDLLSRRTGGNMHFVIQFLHMLHSEGLLVYSDELNKWVWDIEHIETQTVVTDNVAKILTAKISRQQKDVQAVLQLAACLGFFFDIRMLESVASSEELLNESRPTAAFLPSDTDPEEIESGDLFFSPDHGHAKFLRLLQIAKSENLIIQTQDSFKFKFAHDRVRQCVYEMIRNPEKREELHLRIGMLILEKNKSKAMGEMHFIAIDQMNRGSRHIKDDETRSKLAELNLESANKAVQKSAYPLSAEFLEKGIALLNRRTMWHKQNYDLCLELHTKSAEMESTLGNFDASDSRVAAVLQCARTLDDKLRAYYVKLDSLGVRRNLDEAISLGLEVLRQIGEKISQHPSTFSSLVELGKTKRVLKGRRGHELLTLHVMTDERKVAAMRLLNSIAFFGWHSDRTDILIFVFLRMTRITLTHGLCKFSPFAFAAFGMLLGSLGDIQQAYDFGTLALQLLEKARSMDFACSAQLLVFGFLEHLKKPLSLITQNLMTAYRVGLDCGQVQYACQCLSSMGGLQVVLGKPLRSMIVDAQRHRRIFEEYHQDFADVLTAPWHQFALNMTGQAANAKVLTGDAMDEARFLSEEFTVATMNVHYVKMFLLYILGDFDGASVELSALERRPDNADGTHYMAYFKILFSGLVSLAMAQKTRRRKYFTGSRKYIAHISKFAKGGGLNCSPMLMLLQAVQKTTERRSLADVKSSFEKAIVACCRSGYTYMEAIAHERAAEYLSDWNEEYEAQSHLNRAWQLFSEWDAEIKVEELEKKYAMLRSAKETTALRSTSIGVEVEGH